MAEDQEDTGNEDYIRVGRVTGHVRNPNRLNVALTRGRDSTIVVCQAALCSSMSKKDHGKGEEGDWGPVGNDGTERGTASSYLEKRRKMSEKGHSMHDVGNFVSS